MDQIIEETPAPFTQEQAHLLRNQAVKSLRAFLAKAREVPGIPPGDRHFGGLKSALAHCIGVLKLAVEEPSE